MEEKICRAKSFCCDDLKLKKWKEVQGVENLFRSLVDGRKVLLHSVERLAGQGVDDVNRPLEGLDDRQSPFGGEFDRVLGRRQGPLDQTGTRLLSTTQSRNDESQD